MFFPCWIVEFWRPTSVELSSRIESWRRRLKSLFYLILSQNAFFSYRGTLRIASSQRETVPIHQISIVHTLGADSDEKLIVNCARSSI